MHRADGSESLDVLLQLTEEASERFDVFTAESASQLLIEADDRPQKAAVQGVPGAGQLDLDCPSVDRAAVPLDEPGLLHAVEVTGERWTFDPDGAGEVELGAPRLALERAQDQPDRDRTAVLG